MTDATNPSFNLTGQTALVTGGGRGLGREFCDVLAEFGADVVCADIDRSLADATCEIIGKHGHKTLAIEVDVSSYEMVQAMFGRAMHEFGKLDILVNNAGVGPPSKLIDETNLEHWHRTIDVNLNGVFYCMKEGLGIMRQQGHGVVVNIASMLGHFACDPRVLAQSPYIAAKHAVVGLTRQAAAEYAKLGIRVNAIAPGFYHGTGLPECFGANPTPEEREAHKQLILKKVPIGRTGDPAELRGLLLYLATDASSYTTGTSVISDGGWTLF